MKRDINQLEEKTFDVVVVGGGIFAACAAWDAVLRGLSVALIEKEDFCSGTSANSFKMIHGGMRYLQHGDIVRLRSSCRERSAFLRIAPHLVQPLPIVIPTYGHGKSGKAFLGAGLLMYDLLTLGRNKSIKDSARQIPITKFLSKKEVLDHFPGLDRDGLTGAVMFYDGQMYNPTRLVFAFIQSAASKGAFVANYVEAVQFLYEGENVSGVVALDKLSGKTLNIKGRAVLNTAGPWSEWLLDETIGQDKPAEDRGTFSRDACFVINRRFENIYALAVQGRTKDPDALLSRPARHLFLVPWRRHTLVGVWHVVWKQHPEKVTVQEQEIQTFIDEINWAYPSLNLSTKDVTMWNAGLVPFGENEKGAENLSYGKRSILIDHKARDNIEGLVTLIGIRYTTARADTAKALNLICKKLNFKSEPCATEYTPLLGGNVDDFNKLVDDVYCEQSLGLSREQIAALAHNHGTKLNEVLQIAINDTKYAQPLGDTTVIKAEVVHAIEKEMAYTLSDVVFRRTDLATGGNPGNEILKECAKLVAELQGWGMQRMEDELAIVNKRFPDWL